MVPLSSGERFRMAKPTPHHRLRAELSRCGSAKRGSRSPPETDSLPRPCFAALKGKPNNSFQFFFPPFFSRKGQGLGRRPKKYNPYINPMIRQNSGFVARLPAFFDRCLTACRMPGGIRRIFRLPPPRQPLKRLRSRRYALHMRASRRHFFE